MKEKRNPAAVIFLMITAVYLLLPFIATFIYSLFVEWTDIVPHGFTFRNYRQLFSDAEFWGSLGRTVLLCTVSVLLTITVMLLAMYVVLVLNRKLAGAMQFICMIPYALQGVILSISIISLYSGTGTLLSNRLMMLFGAYTVLVLPYIYQGIRNSLNAINAKCLLDAAQMLGIGTFRAYFKVVIPNILPGVFTSALLAESIVFGDFVLANNIAGNNYQNIQVFLSRRMFKSSGLASAIVVIIFLVILLMTWLVLKLQDRQSAINGK